MAIDKLIIGNNRQSRLTAGVDENNFVRVQDLNKVVDDANTDIAANTALINALAPSTALQIAEVSLSAADLIAMNATPVEVVAAPGAGLALEFVSATMFFDYGTTQFTGGGNIYLETADGYTVSNLTGAAAITSAADAIIYMAPVGVVSDADNQALQITNATAAFATGDGVARIKVAYRVHSSGL